MIDKDDFFFFSSVTEAGLGKKHLVENRQQGVRTPRFGAVHPGLKPSAQGCASSQLPFAKAELLLS